MIIVDSALKRRQKEENPVKVGLIGAGYMGRGVVIAVENYVPGMKVSAIYNRTQSRSEQAYEQAGIDTYKITSSVAQLDRQIKENGYAIAKDPNYICQSEQIDVIIEATGEIEFGAKVALEAINNGKHIVLLNAELDATIGPILKVYADKKGVVITNTDGDQPGVIMNLFRFAETIGYRPVLAGNIKGMLDPYRTPATQKAFAEKYNQQPKMVTSFADGTKLSMEMAVVANATGFRVGKRGMYGPECKNVKESLDLFSVEELLDGGRVDYILGAEPGPGVFVIGYNDHPILKEYMPVFKMGDGPLYLFYVPYHLPHLEVPITAARAALFGDATIAPQGQSVCEVITLAKRDLKAGEKLDGIGGFTCYGVIENSSIARANNMMPMGLCDEGILKNSIKKDQVITLNDVELNENQLSYNLWNDQFKYFP